MAAVPPPKNDGLFDTRTDEELAAALSDVDDAWIATELMAQGDGLTLGQAMNKVEKNRERMAAKVMRGLTDES